MDILKTAYLASEGYEKQLLDELKGVIAVHGRLVLTNQEPQKTFWAQNVWYEPFISTFQSISEGAAILKNIQRNWAFYPLLEHRRAALIKAKLPFISEKPVAFPHKPQENNMGSWVLLDKHTMLASGKCSSPYANGLIAFDECKEGPPSRAYLKLWEGLTLAGKMPGKDTKCLEIGASPGGWTWVLAKLGAQVISVDRSELAPNVAFMEGVHFIKGDAFSMTPSKIGVIDWIFSDVACYPEKLLEWVQLWIVSGMCKNFICTLKFQGENSYGIVNEFAKIPGSRILHLGNNKHELTWILTELS
jgi:23S rRNA (cytidine2498-2'-O)-methyltransferase